MSLPGRNLFRAAALLSASVLLSASLLAQAVTNQSASAQADSTPGRSLMARPPELPPPLPVLRSPIAFFRELLAMNAAQRKQALTNRSPESRTQILAKVREYELLKPDDRELRLRVTELRWYLLPLLTAPATNRPAELDMIPGPNRALVEARLQEWDKLAPEVQKALLTNQAVIQHLADLEGRTDDQRRAMLQGISPARREALVQGINHWSAMSEGQRQQVLTRFREFFELTEPEKQRALNTLSGPERRQIEKTLQTFGNLSPEQRALCIQSFAKFADLRPEERQQFLKSADRWKQMSPGERRAWRDVVRTLPAILPPDLPPLPPSHPPPRLAPTVATNGN